MRSSKIAVAVGATAAMLLALPTRVLAQTSEWGDVCVYQNDKEVATIQGVQCLLANVLSVSLTLLGILGFVMMVIGAMRWLSSGGNTQQTEKAGKTMAFAFLGLVLALSAFMIVNLVAQFTGVKSILNFVIPSSDTNW